MRSELRRKGPESFPRIPAFTVYIGNCMEGHNEKVRFVVAIVVLCAFGLLAFGSPRQDTLKVDVNLVNVFVTVKDAAGNFVSDLNRDDFRVYDDDDPQKIDVFETQEQV